MYEFRYKGQPVSSAPPPTQKMVKVTLGWENWPGYEQTVDVEGVVAEEGAQLIIPVPTRDSRDEYYDCDVQCDSQGDGTLTFVCEDKPTEDLEVFIYISEMG